MGIPDHLTCLLRNLYAGQEATVRTGHGTTDCTPTERSMSGLYIVTLLINLHAEYIMRNAELDEAQAGIKIAGRNVNNVRYADDTTLMTESEEETQEPLDECERGDCKAGLKLNIQKVKIMASSPITSWHTDEETKETVTDFIFLGSKITVGGDCSHEIRRHLFLGRKASYAQPRQHIKKQSHYFADKIPHSQSYSFSSSHVQM